MSRVHLGDVAIEHKETCKEDKSMYPIVGLEHLTPEQITLQNWDLNTENTFTKVFRKGNILFGRRRAYLKKAAVAPFDGICSGDITVIEAKEDKIIPELLPFVIQNDDLFDFAVGKSAGSLSPRVKWTHLQNYEFELPDKQKQHELAKVLWAIEDTRKSYQQLIKRTDELVKSQFIELFGDPFCNEHWNCKPLDQIFSMIGRGKQPKYVENSNIRVINQACIYWDGIKYENVKFHDSTSKKAKLTLEPGDVLINSTGTGTLGRAQVFDIGADEIEYITDSHVTVLRGTEKILPQFFQMILSLPETQSRIYADCVNGSTNQIELSKEKLCALEVITPDIVLQKQFVDFIKQSDKSKFGKEMCDKWILEIQNSWYQMYRILHQ